MTAALFIGYLALGLAHMAPTVTTGDSGEFAAAAATLGLPHAPSFPFYCLAAKAFGTALPFGNWAYRTNLFSLLCGALGIIVLYHAALRLRLSKVAALLGAVVLGLGPTALYHNLVTEVFAINTLWAALGLYLLARHREDIWSERSMALFGLWTGLGLGNHHTILLVGPAFAVEAFRAQTPSWAVFHRAAHRFAFFLVLGLGLYFYLPIRSSHAPPLDWGHPVTWAGVLHTFLRRDYGSFALTVAGPQPLSAGSAFVQLGRFARGVVHAGGVAGALWGVAGLVVWSRRREGLGGPFPWAYLFFTGPFFLLLGNPPVTAELEGALPRFYLLSIVGLALGAAVAADELERRVGRWAWLAPALTALAFLPSRPAWALRSDLMAYDYGRNVLRSLPPDSYFFMDGGDDTFYTLAFLQSAEGRRPDIELHDRGGLVFRNPYGPDFRRLPKPEKEARRVEVETVLARSGRLSYSTMKSDLLPGWELRPAGLVWPAVAAGSGKSLGADELFWPLYPYRVEPALLSAHYRDRALAAYPPFMRGLSEGKTEDWEGLFRDFGAAASIGPDVLWLKDNLVFNTDLFAFEASRRGEWRLVERLYRLSLESFPDHAATWSNLGVCLEKQGRLDEAENAQNMALGVDPRFGPAHYNLGLLAWKRSDWRQAADQMEQAAALDPQPAWLHYRDEARRRAEAVR